MSCLIVADKFHSFLTGASLSAISAAGETSNILKGKGFRRLPLLSQLPTVAPLRAAANERDNLP
jgi:hypothetical protein